MRRFTVQWLVAAIMLAGMLAMGTTIASAQDKPAACGESPAPAPSDGFESGGLGLICTELEELYGPGEIGQSSMYFTIDGIRVDTSRGGLNMRWTEHPDDEGVEEEEARAFAAQFLPADAKSLGNFNLGGVLFPFADLELYESESLAERFAALELPYTGHFVVVYNDTGDGMNRTGVESVEIMPTSLDENAPNS
jgi:hypothetical protein